MRLSSGGVLPWYLMRGFLSRSCSTVPVAQGMIDGSLSSSDDVVTQESLDELSASDSVSWVASSEDGTSAVAVTAWPCSVGGV